MYAIIRAGGKQAKVSEGDVIDVERLKATGEVTFTPLLVVDDSGTVISDRDVLAESKVVAEVLGEHRGDKVEVFKYKNKTGYRRRQGHRQTYTTIQVKTIEGPGTKPKKAAAKKSAQTEAKQPKAEAKPKAESTAKAEAKPKAESAAKADTAAKAQTKTKAADAAEATEEA